MAANQNEPGNVECPSCKKNIKSSLINSHLDICLEVQITDISPVSPKRARLYNVLPVQKSAEKNLTSPVSSSGRSIDISKWGCLGSSRVQNEQKQITPLSISNQIDSERVNGCKSTFAPLAEQMRPSLLEDYRGQEKLVGQGTMLRKLLENNEIPSMILWGPPGCGKTSMAHIIATQCKKSGSYRYIALSAVSTGVKEVKEIMDAAKNQQKMLKKKTVLFFDEIHRFNKLQQDVFLPAVENGTIVLIGATTENPSFTLNSALLSRCRVFVLDKLCHDDVSNILQQALKRLDVSILDDEKRVQIDDRHMYIGRKALILLADFCDGDARTALNSLQMAVQSKQKDYHQLQNCASVITEEDVKEGLQRSHLLYDRKGDQHYDVISAFIKSMRGSDSNAALYWLARMVEGGEDPRFIARRMVVFASEDVGIADPTALTLAVSTFQSCQTIGLPECRINLSHCAVYLARAKKSRETYDAYTKAEECIRNHRGPIPSVPLHLRNAPTKLMKQLGYGKGNKYELGFLPETLKHINFFTK